MTVFSRNILCLLVMIWGAGYDSAPAQALESGWQGADYMRARLLTVHPPALSDAGAEGDFTGAVMISLDEGYYTYWHMPGDSGLPPQFDWSGSKNLAQARISWPFPERFETAGFQSFGYDETVVLPFSFQRKKPDQPATLSLEARFLVCKDICVPQSVSLTLDIPADHYNDQRYAAVIERALDRVPALENRPGLKIINTVVGPDALVVTAYAKWGFDQADIFVSGADDFYITARPEIIVNEHEPRRALLRLPLPDDMDGAEGLSFTLTLTDGREAIAQNVTF